MSRRHASSAEPAHSFDDTLIELGSGRGGFPETPRVVATPLLEALGRAGTSHVYGDTASVSELRALVERVEGEVLDEIDGNTANQPLVRKVFDHYVEGDGPLSWARALCERRPGLGTAELLPLLYAIVCGRIGHDMVRAFAAHRIWEVSLQLHMGLVRSRETAVEVGRCLRRMVLSALVKVPFAPYAPDCFLIARDLEREHIPVNFTSTFSARQAVAAALLCDATRTNVFMGRLNQGLRADRLGEHVDLEAQRALLELRRDHGVKTQLIVASVHDWRSLVLTAGCDVYTAPCPVLTDFLEQTEVGPEALESQLETSYADRLGIAEDVRSRLGAERIGRLWRVEPELVEFLLDLRRSGEHQRLADGEALVRRFEEAGFGDFFHVPDEEGWRELRRGKLPDLDAPLTRRLPLDTLFSLLADADFEAAQDEMDARLERCLERY